MIDFWPLIIFLNTFIKKKKNLTASQDHFRTLLNRKNKVLWFGLKDPEK